MDFAQILEKLAELELTPRKMGSFAQNEECYDDGCELDVMGILEDNFGKVEVAEKSYFHDGHECWCVYSFKEHDVHLKYTGYFSSYDDTSWKKPFEVLAREKTIIEFTRK